MRAPCGLHVLNFGNHQGAEADEIKMTVRVFRLLQNLRFSLEKLEARLLERLGGHPPLGNTSFIFCSLCFI